MNLAARASNVVPAQNSPSRSNDAANGLPKETSCDSNHERMKEDDHISKTIYNAYGKEIHQGTSSKSLYIQPDGKATSNETVTAKQNQAQSLLAPQTLMNGLSTPLGFKQSCVTNFNSALHLKNGEKLGQFTSTPKNCSALLSPSLVLVSTTISSANNVTDLDISSGSNSLSLLANWGDVAITPESQPELNNESEQLEVKQTSHTLAGEATEPPMVLKELAALDYDSFENSRKTTLNPSSSKLKSVAYRSPNTTIYNIRNVKQTLNTSTFKLPSAIPSISRRATNLSGAMQSAKLSMPLPDFHKRKRSTTRLYSPLKKQPFTIYKDMASSSLSLPMTSSHSVPPTVLNCTVNSNQPFKIKENGKMTPPFCNCGRRAKRLLVSNPSPNQGRAFYSCPVGKRNEGNWKGCGYFKWEHSLLKAKSSSSASFLSKSGMSSDPLKTNSVLSGSQQRKHLGLRPSMRT